jgi:hypothetical protein
MLEQQGNALPFEAFFSESKLGKTGLTVTVDVFENLAQIISSGIATEVGKGLYYYQLPAINVDADALYSAVFKTTTSTVDLQEVPAMWVVGRDWVDRIDVDTSSRATASGVWTYITRTLTESGGSTLTAEEVWTYATRTITGLNVTVADLLDSLSETVVSIRRGDTYVQTFVSPEVLSGYTSLWYTIKGNINRTEADPQSIIQIKKNSSGIGDGLLYINGASADNLIVEIDESVTAQFTPVMNKPIDIQMLKDGDVTTLIDGTARIYGDVTRSLT